MKSFSISLLELKKYKSGYPSFDYAVRLLYEAYLN
jgi:hypothetical protein